MIYLTVINKHGNHGHQLKDYFGALVISKLFDFTFANNKYDYLDFFALHDGEKEVSSLSSDIHTINISKPCWWGLSYDEAKKIFLPIHTQFRNKDCLVVLKNSVRIHPCQTIDWYRKGMIDKDIYTEVVSNASRKFSRRHINRPTYFQDDCINVAVHIGRGPDYDPVKNPKLFEISRARKPRYMFPISYFEEIIRNLKKVIGSRKYQIHIYTESSNSEEIVDTFENRENVILHIGNNRGQKNYDQIHDIFFHFVKSDILVTCNSSFSVVATYFRQNKINIYHEHNQLFDLPPDTNLATELNGQFDTARLRRIL